MIDTLLSSNFVPFSLALGLLFALLALEILSHLVGSSLFSADDGPDFDLDAAAMDSGAFDFDPGMEIDIDALPDPADLDAPAMPSGGGVLDLMGLTGVPLLLWFAALLLSFGVAGLVLQGLAGNLLGAPLPGLVAALIALPLGLAGARSFARAFAAVLPKTETTATRAQFFGGLRGTVTQGTARHGHPAEVRLHDRHGNIHYIRAEPFTPTDTIPEGTEVVLIRERRGPGDFILRLVPVPAV
ncbi:OB-fold-containig protein [Ovoidimarina sediminis]|uniref:OB-fold-containig protein n=1 Tax=Ovoidimarina sediminis TaxID=3079856 RepID=UPI00290872B7|nr:OB-fold-containig protein [Rhodophyticola sp. MJ-SS7]MDU8944364.1 DUF1449 family protein [Rhodophyticola sp. MJ-SS7]